MLSRFQRPLTQSVARQARTVVTISSGHGHEKPTNDSNFAKAAGLFGISGLAYATLVKKSEYIACETTKEVNVGKDADFLNGQMYEIPVGDDRQILVTRHDGKLYAIGAKCSHYGFPLAKGVKCDNEVVCPLHDAAFDVRTGRPVRGPGLDAIPTYAIRVHKGDVLVTVPAGESFPSKVQRPMSRRDPKNPEVYVIVGGGAAGLTAAETLRHEGFTGRVVMVSAEPHLPYDRPVLSKKLPVAGKIDGLYLRSREYFDSGDIELILGSPVEEIDINNKTIKIKNSNSLNYSKCLIATGGSPRQLFIPGMDAKNVFLLRSVDDAVAINEMSERGQKVVVIGGSFIGMEMASTLIQKGVDVTVVAKTAVPYERILGRKVGAFFANLLSDRDIRYIGNSTVKIIRKGEEGQVIAVELDDGDVLPADAVIVGAGVVPNTEIVSGIHLSSDGSIPVNPFMQSREAPDLFAAGDIVTFPYVKTGQDLRVEHWDVAIQQGRVAALNMLNQKIPYNEIPFFWTMVFGKSLRYVGNVGAEAFDNVLIEGDLLKGEFVAYYTLRDKITAVATVGRDPVAVACAELMKRNAMPSPSEIQIGIINSDGIIQRVRDMNDPILRKKLIK
jgi:NADPH-dependent 2,4-dienoyl-CoA reductase/sulfur reductase-like enzyme/nitrite reductase/ring-hydroxylating ferredoxin subunit